jgi:uncharacterized protein YoxC
MTYAINPYASYNAYQPATIAQLDRLRHWTDRVADRCDDMLDALDRVTGENKELHDSITDLRNACGSLAARINAVENKTDANAAGITDLNRQVDDINARITAVESSGYITGVSFTDLDTGVLITANGTKCTTHHQITVEGDGYSMARVEHGQNSTAVHLTGKGGLGDPARITLSGDTADSKLQLTAPDGTRIGSVALGSTDSTVRQSVNGTDIDVTMGDGLKKRLDDTDSHVDDTDRKHSQRPTLDDIDIAVGNTGTSTTYVWKKLDGTTVKSKTVDMDVVTDGTVTATTEATTGGCTLRLSATDQLKRLPLLESSAKLATDTTGLTLSHAVYHPQTGAVSDDGDDHVPVSGDDTMTVDLTHGITLSAEPAVSKAAEMDDALSDILTKKIKEQADRIDTLSHTVAELQTAVRTAMDTADRSVTNATLTLTGEDDDGATVTLSLLSRSGVEVARLPVTLRVKSTNGTVKAGVQTNGNVATLAIDVV